MQFQPFYLSCLAHGSYLIGDGGDAVVIDPQRDVDAYLDEARARGLTIRHVIETHLHADFVSGHVELATRTAATIWLGPGSGATFAHRVARDGDELRIGNIVLRFLETPGHTPESISVLLLDAAGRPRSVFTGDTLFVGDVGRPDLVASRGFTAAEMASMMYDSLRSKLLVLPDDVEVWPAHGAGSACGRAIGQERSSTIGAQRLVNWALADMGRENFVRKLTTDLPPVPAYFLHDATMNREGPPPVDDRPARHALSALEVSLLVDAGALVVDVRDAEAWARGHVPGSLNLGLRGSFASWAGSLIPVTRQIVIVAGADAEPHEAVVRLARVGIERVAGFLSGGIAAWRAAGLPISAVTRLDPLALSRHLAGRRPPLVVDVRRPGEWVAGHVPGAINIPIDTLRDRAGDLDPAQRIVVVCAGGYRSAAAAGLLEAAGRRVTAELAGGTSAWMEAGLPVQREAGPEARIG